MTDTVYQWRPGTRIPVKAQVAGDRIAEIREANGGHVTPSIVVDDARPEESPLHDGFEWNDSIAAEKHREEQARTMLRCLRTIHVDADGTERPTVGYVHVELSETGPAYVSTVRAMSDEDLREQVIAEALAGLAAWQRRVAHLQELAPLMEAIRLGLAQVEKRRPARKRATAGVHA